MPQSDVNQVTFFQEYYLGDPPPFFAGEEETQDNAVLIQVAGEPDFVGYPYSMNVSSAPPHPDRILTRITLSTESGIDSDGVTYGGNFRPETDNITVVGNLSVAEKLAIQNSITVNTGNLNNGIVTDEYIVNTFNLASIGIKEFGYIIPYVDRDIVVPGGTIEVPFIRLTSTGSSRETQIVVTPNDPRQLIIDDGTEVASESVMLVENISLPGERDFNTLTAEVTSSEFKINYDEITQDRLIFKITPRSSEIPNPSQYTSNFSSSYPIVEFDLEFYLEFNSSGIVSRRFKTRPYARETTRPDTATNTSLRAPNYARITCGNGLAMSYEIVGSTITYSFSSFGTAFGRRTPDVLTFSNNFGTAIELEVDTDLERIRIRGVDSLGVDVAQIFLFSTYVTIKDIAQAINDWIETVDGWSGQVSMTVNDSSYNDFMASEFLDDLDTVNVTTSRNLAATIPVITSGDPDYTWEYSIANKTFRDVFDVRARYEEAFGQELNLPVTEYDAGGMPDSWLDWPNLPKLLRSTISSTPTSQTPDIVTFLGNSYSLSSTDPEKFLYYYEDDTLLPWASLAADDIQDVCDYLNDEISFIFASPGLYYGRLDAEAVQPTLGSWTRDGSTIISDKPENSSIITNKIQIRGGQQNIGGFAQFPVISYIDDLSVDISSSTQTVDQLVSTIIDRYPGILTANALNGNEQVEISEFAELSPTSLEFQGNSATISAEFEQPVIETYQLSNFSSIESLVSVLNQDWNSRDIFAETVVGTQDRPDAIPTRLLALQTSVDLTDDEQLLLGEVFSVVPTAPPERFIYLEYDLGWVGNSGPGVSEQGIQVALGGYKSNGEYFINSFPNAFFEPGFNSLFDVRFSVSEAEEVYVLVRTRQDVDGSDYTSNAADYQGLTRFSNGFPSQVTNAIVLSGSPFDAWADADWKAGEIPAVFVIPAEANSMTLLADDTAVLDSIQVQIDNFAAEIDEFAFLAINRTNLNASMTSSRQGGTFGLVLDNRGIWDVLIGPEAELRRVADGEFDYLNFSFDHDPLDSDEAYNYGIFNSGDIDPTVLNSIEVVPVPGFPKVAVLRIESGVKRYLSQLKAASPANSLDACSLDIDISVEGRETGTQGVARVTIFTDYTCVYDIGLCDFFWNLSDPPGPQPPDVIENTLAVSYTDYIDCQRLDVDGTGDNSRISFPILVTVEGVPVFENGNALLLIKGTYSASVEGYFFPSQSQFGTIQNSECVNLGDNEPLSDRLNREMIFVNGEDEPIIDPVLISQIINGTEPYMYIKPRFQFPGIDQEFECGPNEVVIASISYQFRDWEPGLRQDDILIGVDSVVSNSTFSAPSLEFCYKYYYRRET